mmetsp:Transcript_25496/g.59959  ORF Transcript_25496/g.59959 Transcript_25496/m.59959 type:complete len:272 (-) Transcript_25496:38-853(-)
MAGRRLALTRLPAVVFPGTPVTLRCRKEWTSASPWLDEAHLSVGPEMMAKVEADGGGLLATVPYGDALGVHLQLERRCDELAHFTVTDRVRFAPFLVTTAVGIGEKPRLLDVEHEALADRAELEGSSEQLERADDEAALAQALVEHSVRSGSLDLDLGLDDFGVDHAELCLHPSWARAKVLPKGASDLSFWLPSRLPLTTELKARFLFAFSSLWRLQAAVDSIRFLRADALHDGRYSHRYCRIVETPATDACGRFAFSVRPRTTIGISKTN